MGRVAHVKEERKELAKDVHRLACLRARFMSISDGGVTVQNGSESSLVADVKEEYGRKHEGKCLASTYGCFGCGMSGRKIMDCRSLTSKGREGRQASPTGSGSSAPKKIRFYALQTHHDQEGSPDAVTGILKVFHLDVYDFLDPGATLCFVKPYVVMRFDVLPNVLL
ncbi:uncharacterized protein LOC125812044 [Solanum verrucosum]|uniref:uncharacterized protein LOC125812044 n=1 Tax=Solanum verrucosum TaxID=315347 RepID=UPI0020CFF102|nr:uncharacterized protein LOC125812044 [Solanum verrucosum]